MKSSLFLALGLAAFICGFSPCLMAEDWTTTDGKVYQNVSVIKVEPDAVTITDHDGGALVPLAKLPPDLQKRFNYDPVKAKAAADVRAQADAKNTVALQAEMAQAHNQQQAALIALSPRSPPIVPTRMAPIVYTPIVSTDSKTSTPPNTHSVEYLLMNSGYLMPDPLTPTHHTTDDLLKSASDLSRPDNSNTHSESSLLGTGDPLARPQ